MIGIALALQISTGSSEYLRVADGTAFARSPAAAYAAPHWPQAYHPANASEAPVIVLTRAPVLFDRDVEQSLIAAQRSAAKVLYTLKVPLRRA